MRFLRRPIRILLQAAARFKPSQPKIREIPVQKILLGGEGPFRAKQYSYLTGDLLRPSTRASSGPHATFLADYERLGERIFDRDILETTSYYKNARDCIRVLGGYFPYCISPDRIVLTAKRFALQFEGKSVAHLPAEGHSREGEVIEVSTIRDSDCYELMEGNHRVAFAARRNQKFITAKVRFQANHTPLQEMVLNGWESRAKEVYQPLGLPEFERSWILLRDCEARFDKMLRFLRVRQLWADQVDRIVDVGSYYGWFVSRFAAAGYNAHGIETDRQAIRIGKLVYGNLEGRVLWGDARTALNEAAMPSDVVCCLSVIHRYIMGKTCNSADELLKLLNEHTRKVLFFEMGEEHEQWFAQSLAGWNKEFIKNWVIKNTDFKIAHELGRDSDSKGRYKNNFGRMLFAFEK
jgi:2-polyprenyl-3-methyl-5-hydroxy-6-metoxy-1,4-benzoquinol methylase